MSVKQHKNTKECDKDLSTKKISEFKNFLEKNCLIHMELREVLKPNGYAECIAKQYTKFSKKELKTTQLRKVFHEIKEISELGKKGKLQEAKTKIWLLYPKIVYAKERGLIPPGLDEIFLLILKNVDEICPDKDDKNFVKALEYLDYFFSALVAYAKKYGKK
jgi:CRISPR-associated protein Csm2